VTDGVRGFGWPSKGIHACTKYLTKQHVCVGRYIRALIGTLLQLFCGACIAQDWEIGLRDVREKPPRTQQLCWEFGTGPTERADLVVVFPTNMQAKRPRIACSLRRNSKLVCEMGGGTFRDTNIWRCSLGWPPPIKAKQQRSTIRCPVKE
jgi:hypothetical protein